MATQVALRGYPWLRAWLERRDGVVEVVAPHLFPRGVRWAIPIHQTAVCDLRRVPDPTNVDFVYEPPVYIAMLSTCGLGVSPTIALLFDSPQTPPLPRRLAPRVLVPYSRRRLRRGAVNLDGLLLQIKDPNAASELAAWGAQEVEDPNAWLMTHRPTIRERAVVDAVLRTERRAIRLDIAGGMTTLVAILGLRVAVEARSAIAVLAGAAALVVGLWMLRRGNRVRGAK